MLRIKDAGASFFFRLQTQKSEEDSAESTSLFEGTRPLRRSFALSRTRGWRFAVFSKVMFKELRRLPRCWVKNQCPNVPVPVSREALHCSRVVPEDACFERSPRLILSSETAPVFEFPHDFAREERRGSAPVRGRGREKEQVGGGK